MVWIRYGIFIFNIQTFLTCIIQNELLDGKSKSLSYHNFDHTQDLPLHCDFRYN